MAWVSDLVGDVFDEETRQKIGAFNDPEDAKRAVQAAEYAADAVQLLHYALRIGTRATVPWTKADETIRKKIQEFLEGLEDG